MAKNNEAAKANIESDLQHYLIRETNFLSVKDKLNEDDLRRFIAKSLQELCYKNEIQMSDSEMIGIISKMVSTSMSLGPIRPLMEDKSISEIMINGPKTIYIQRAGKIELTNIKFEDNAQVLHFAQKLLATSGSGRRVDESSPYVDFSLSDGSRVNVIVPPVSLVGPVITIRKFSTDIGTVDDLLNLRMLNKPMATLLIAAIKAKLNVVFCGATGTGKTTILNVLSRHIPSHERIVTIEDTSELRLLQEHVVSLQSKPSNIEGKGAITIRDLFVNSLRMRPDRIIIGEVRTDEALDMVQAISSGHSGSLAIVHADSPEDCFNRLVTMVLMSGIRLSVEEIKKQIACAIDLIVHTELFMDGFRRISYITDIRYTKETNAISLEHIFYFKQDKVTEEGRVIGDWVMNRKKPSFYHKLVKRQAELPAGFFEDTPVHKEKMH